MPSTELFPIHHLDDLEFFPCDFVVSTSGKTVINGDIWHVVAIFLEALEGNNNNNNSDNF